MSRLLGILLSLLCAIAAAVLTWPDFFRLSRTFPLTQIVSFRSLVALAFAALAVVALLLSVARPVRRVALPIALVAVLAVGANATIIVSRER